MNGIIDDVLKNNCCERPEKEPSLVFGYGETVNFGTLIMASRLGKTNEPNDVCEKMQ